MTGKTIFTNFLLLCFSVSALGHGGHTRNLGFGEGIPLSNPDSLEVQDDSIKSYTLREVVITKRLNHLNEISKVDLKVNPVNSSQEVLRTVPGLFIAQHAGGGKAEQMFLRGFDLDHGTDINISVDGMPVNMVSDTFSLGNVHESSLFAYAGANIEWGKWMINPAVRIDYFSFDYVDRTLAEYTNPKVTKAIVSPKLNFIYHLNSSLQFFLKMGKGFHSNDARVVIPPV